MNMNVVQFYREQLKSFDKIGIGNKTNSGVVVTHKLINITNRRLNQLTLLPKFPTNSLCARCNGELKSNKEKEKK